MSGQVGNNILRTSGVVAATAAGLIGSQQWLQLQL